MLADVERVLRTEFHSAGQTELKLWLEQLARRDDAPTIGKQRLDTSGIVKDRIDDRPVGGHVLRARRRRQGIGADRARVADAARTGEAAASRPGRWADRRRRCRSPAPRAGSGFWLGVMFTLAAVVGLRYAKNWAEQKGVCRVVEDGRRRQQEPGPEHRRRRRPPRSRPRRRPPAPRPTRRPPPAPTPPAPVAVRAGARHTRARRPAPAAQAAPDAAPRRRSPTTVRPTRRAGDPPPPGRSKDDDDEIPTRRRCCATRSRTPRRP